MRIEMKILFFLMVAIMPLAFAWLYALPPVVVVGVYILFGAGYLFQKYVPTTIKSGREPASDAFDYAQKFWRENVKSGESLTYEEQMTETGYWNDDMKIIGLSAKRGDTQKRILFVMRLSPKEILFLHEEPLDSTMSPFDYLYKEFGIRPLPAPRIDIGNFIAKKKPRKRPELSKKGEEESTEYPEYH